MHEGFGTDDSWPTRPFAASLAQTTSLPLPTRQRSQQEYLIRILTTLRIPFDACDVSLDGTAGVSLSPSPPACTPEGVTASSFHAFTYRHHAPTELGKRIWRRKGRTNGALPGYLVRGEVSPNVLFDDKLKSGGALTYWLSRLTGSWSYSVCRSEFISSPFLSSAFLNVSDGALGSGPR